MVAWQIVEGGVTAPKGFKAAGIRAGLKPSGAPDLAMIVSDNDAIAAATLTQSQVRAACVDHCQQRLENRPSARAVVCNAGQANACTGQQGVADAVATAEAAASVLKIDAAQILLASTGVIGQRIKLEPLLAALPDLAAALSETGSDAAAQAIVTTDLVPKSIALETQISGSPVRIGGIAKGSGMIHPNMATMLGFVTCDAAVSPPLWQAMLSRAVDKSFNQITVDGDTSTNDTLIALANGASRTPAITGDGPVAIQLEAMLTEVCIHLAKAIARDGEGATCLLEINVSGAPSDTAARTVARTIAGSSLVKSAVFGRDPNWGRIAGAAGRAGVPFDQNQLSIQLGETVLMRQGQPQVFDGQVAHQYLVQQSDASVKAMQQQIAQVGQDMAAVHRAGRAALATPVQIAVDLGAGQGVGTAWGCDLSYDYVKINAEYTT
ncbi:MAG: bifunctional ornithine acetyltransferase/N-acetylglutamate synthase [Cyanobacteria bacterium P01_A01_bin.105]